MPPISHIIVIKSPKPIIISNSILDRNCRVLYKVSGFEIEQCLLIYLNFSSLSFKIEIDS